MGTSESSEDEVLEDEEPGAQALLSQAVSTRLGNHPESMSAVATTLAECLWTSTFKMLPALHADKNLCS